MGTFRPAVKENDGLIQKIIKYIPAEIIAGYMSLTGYLAIESQTEMPDRYKTYYITLVCLLAIVTPIWTYFAVLDGNASEEEKNKKRAIFHAVISFLAFIIWVFAIGNPILTLLLCGCTGTTCVECYKPLGSMFLLGFTLITPLIERIVLGTKLL